MGSLFPGKFLILKNAKKNLKSSYFLVKVIESLTLDRIV